MSKRVIFLSVVFALSCGSLWAQQQLWQPAPGTVTMQLWPGAAPYSNHGAQPNQPAESTKSSGKDGLVAGREILIESNVSTPTLTLYKPKVKNTGAAVVVFPGGGYYILAIDIEGTEVCDWLNSAGIACVLVKYRVPGTGHYPQSAAALQDAQRAVGLVRQHAIEWQIDPNRIGVLGFSAGGHLVAALSTHFDKRVYDPMDAADILSCRPDFAVLVYPAYLTADEKDFAFDAELTPRVKTPPTFIVQAEDDPVHVENAVSYFLALKKAHIPAELHVFAEGGHGYGLRPTALPITGWPRSAEAWLRTIKVLPAQQ